MPKLKSLATLGAATAVAALMATGATAATYGTIPGSGTNDALAPIFGAGTTELGGWYGASLYLISGTEITVEYLGAEAANKNTFHWDGTQFAATPGNASWTAGTESETYAGLTPGLLTFGFGINSTLASLFNGSNPDDSAHDAGQNFFVSFADQEASSGSVVYLFLDDGDQSDDNHDDMVIRLTAAGGNISIAPVPVPAAGFLLLGGLGVLGAASRRRRRHQA